MKDPGKNSKNLTQEGHWRSFIKQKGMEFPLGGKKKVGAGSLLMSGSTQPPARPTV